MNRRFSYRTRLAIGIAQPVIAGVHTVLCGLLLLVIVPYAIYHGLRGRRFVNGKPRLYWGPYANIGTVHQSRAMRTLGYHSMTHVMRRDALTTDNDYDVIYVNRYPLLRKRAGRVLLEPYFRVHAFLQAVRDYDVFCYFFHWGILDRTPLKRLEAPLLHLADKRLVLQGYGSDIAAFSRMTLNVVYKHTLNIEYPSLALEQGDIEARLRYYTRHADHIIASHDQVDRMERWDTLVSCQFVVDAEQWQPPASPAAPPASDGVRVLHAPNHRAVKGTQFLIDAVETLRAEGLPVELVLVERQPNAALRAIMASCDIVADQFVIGWYAQFAIEGMSMGKPVLTYLHPELVELYTHHSYHGECPIVNTHYTQITDVLRELVRDHDRRIRLGQRGRAFVLKHHSPEGMGRRFDAIFAQLW